MEDNIFLKKVGVRISEFRQSRNLSKADLAKKMIWNRAGITRIEAGESPTSIVYYKKVADALAITLSDLFEGI